MGEGVGEKGLPPPTREARPFPDFSRNFVIEKVLKFWGSLDVLWGKGRVCATDFDGSFGDFPTLEVQNAFNSILRLHLVNEI